MFKFTCGYHVVSWNRLRDMVLLKLFKKGIFTEKLQATALVENTRSSSST